MNMLVKTTKVTRFFQLVIFVFVYSFGAMQTVYGEDTEIFFAPEDDVDGIYPNIMFIIDSSGSMGWGVDGTTDSRMEVVQDVMDEVLTDITNVNAGLMRFNNGRGGGVLYPILNIDEEATPSAFQTIKSGGNDAHETILTGTVDLINNNLEFNGSQDWVGVRFENLNIPQGASILSATVTFTAEQSSAGAADVMIFTEAVDSAAFVSTTAYELSSRATSNASTNSVNWSIEDWTDEDVYATPDISVLVQEVTDRAGWCGGNDFMVFFKRQSGAARYAYSKDGIDADSETIENIFAPRISVQYSSTFVPTANKCMTSETVSQINSQDNDFQIRNGGVIDTDSNELEFHLDEAGAVQEGVGIAFEDIRVPKDAIINYAYIEFVSDDDSDVGVFGDSLVDIYGVNADTVSLPVVNPTGINSILSNAGVGPVNWVIAEDWINGSSYDSVDISSIISSITSRAGWNLGQNLAIVLKGSQGWHSARSHGGPGAKLHIGYRGVWEPGANTIREDLKAAVAGLTPSGGTPISSTYAEAGEYFLGNKVNFGSSRNDNRRRRVSHPLSYQAPGTVIRDPGCTDDNLDDWDCASEHISGNPNYKSPVVEECQTNHIVFLTDGSSNSHSSTVNDIYGSWTGGGTCSSSNGGNDCSIKMAGWLNTNDISSSLASRQFVKTHMIGFGPGADPELMQQMATAGGGNYYAPDNRETLISDITDIVDSIASISTSFVTSGVTVNQYNRLTHNDQLYFSLFTPQSGISWPGNIKRYKLLGGSILDANSNAAIAPLSSEFKDDSTSFWSDVTDGNDVQKGGAAGELSTGRNLYSNISSSALLNDSNNAVVQSNPLITTSMLGGVTSQRRDTILYWADGYDVNHAEYIAGDSSSLASTPARKNIGDPLHSQPTVLQYNDGSGDPLTTRIYVGTNHGYLHSFNADNGSEEWAFIPKKLLGRLDQVVDNADGNHSYGLDGSVAIHIIDSNGNGAVDPGEKASLYIGQRRGGNSYYALDISSPDNPKLLFKIDGGSGGYNNLGQTWSTPTLGKMDLSGVNNEKLVMIFGGGYDVGQDNAGTSSSTDTTGNALYIADAYDGSLLWNSIDDTQAHGGSAGSVTTMNGVASKVTAFDFNEDELIDHLYVTDSKAQVFRFDVDNSARSIKGGRIAHLNDGGSSTNNRRFYYSADTALIRQVGDSFVSVSMGSGYRAHPLDETVEDHFYVLKDKGVISGVFDMDASLSDLQDVTSLLDTDSNGISDAVEVLNDDTANKKGWYIDFVTSGEKVIERSITFNNAVIFTSYIPPGADGVVCQAAAGGGRLYALNILNGNPYVDTNDDGSLNENDRYVELVGAGIAPQPQVLLEGGDDGVTPRLCVGTECGFDEILPPLSKGVMGIKWRRN